MKKIRTLTTTPWFLPRFAQGHVARQRLGRRGAWGAGDWLGGTDAKGPAAQLLGPWTFESLKGP